MHYKITKKARREKITAAHLQRFIKPTYELIII